MDKEFYDLVYDAWMSGRNPDRVSEDRYDDCLAQGYYPDEISLSMVLPKRKEPPCAICGCIGYHQNCGTI